MAVAGVAARMVLEQGAADTILESRIVLTAVAARPQIAEKASSYLTGKQPSKEIFKQAARMASEEAEPITDIRGTAAYRTRLVEVLTRRALEEALTRALAEGV